MTLDLAFTSIMLASLLLLALLRTFRGHKEKVLLTATIQSQATAKRMITRQK